jgi:hypothetical protein
MLQRKYGGAYHLRFRILSNASRGRQAKPMQLDNSFSALQRAFALADEGKRFVEIRGILSREGFDLLQLNSPTVAKELTDRGRSARARKAT